MEGLYVIEKPINYPNLSGVDKKILAQVGALNNAGFNCTIFCTEDSKPTSIFGRIWSSVLRRFPYSNVPKWENSDYFRKADFLYIRKPSCVTRRMIKVLSNAKKENPKLRIIMEIPTYPYDNELTLRIWDIPILFRDRANRKNLKDVIDIIAAISDEPLDCLFDVKTIRLMNGAPFSRISKRNPIVDEVIDLCCVANFSKWHGYERLLNGLIDYFERGGQRKIRIHFVGAGREIPKYRKIATHPLIRESVLFYGKTNEEILDGIYDIADFGVEALGIFKKKLVMSSSIKSREYLAKGIPVITGCPVDVFEKENFDYNIEFPNDTSIISVDKVVDFYDQLYNNRENVEMMTSKIREYGRKNVDVNVTMRPIIDYINSLNTHYSGFDRKM